MEGTTFDTESEAWWREAMDDTTPGDPCPDPWKCQWCGKPWHGNHPEYQRPAEVEDFWNKRLAELGVLPQQETMTTQGPLTLSERSAEG